MDGYLLHYAFDMIIEGPKIMETIYYLIPSLSQEHDLDFPRKIIFAFVLVLPCLLLVSEQFASQQLMRRAENVILAAS